MLALYVAARELGASRSSSLLAGLAFVVSPIIAAGLVPETNAQIELENLKAWLKDKIPAYRIPRQYLILEDLPRNTLGKVTKNDLKKQFAPQSS